MKWEWLLQFHVLIVTSSVCHGGRQRRMGSPRESNGVVRLTHGSFECMGALLTSRIVLTCCTCVSDVYFRCEESQDQVTYEVRALNAENVTVKSEDERRVAGKNIFVHPQCDIDGTYDYGIVTLVHGISGRGGEDCLTALRRSFNSQYSLSQGLEAQKKALSRQPSGICVLHTILDDSADGEILQILTQFVDWKHCWNGSETKPSFESKYCLMAINPGVYLENAKCGSPIYCERKLVGILARRYAIAGHVFGSVNGLDGAIEFIKETVKLDIREESGDREEGQIDLKKMSKKTKYRRMIAC